MRTASQRSRGTRLPCVDVLCVPVAHRNRNLQPKSRAPRRRATWTACAYSFKTSVVCASRVARIRCPSSSGGRVQVLSAPEGFATCVAIASISTGERQSYGSSRSSFNRARAGLCVRTWPAGSRRSRHRYRFRNEARSSHQPGKAFCLAGEPQYSLVREW